MNLCFYNKYTYRFTFSFTILPLILLYFTFLVHRPFFRHRFTPPHLRINFQCLAFLTALNILNQILSCKVTPLVVWDVHCRQTRGSASAQLSKPVTATSSGTRSPASCSACIAPIAILSLAHTIHSGSSSESTIIFAAI